MTLRPCRFVQLACCERVIGGIEYSDRKLKTGSKKCNFRNTRSSGDKNVATRRHAFDLAPLFFFDCRSQTSFASAMLFRFLSCFGVAPGSANCGLFHAFSFFPGSAAGKTPRGDAIGRVICFARILFWEKKTS
ncbi:MAG: hypothetical protein ACKVP2_16420 [Burkholderiales bacterium]